MEPEEIQDIWSILVRSSEENVRINYAGRQAKRKLIRLINREFESLYPECQYNGDINLTLLAEHVADIFNLYDEKCEIPELVFEMAYEFDQHMQKEGNNCP